ncbi:MAG: uncharacterized protein JWL77_6882 [Chthonomonadaceae bacterium]|nr:uncharacterized protein [Chthonomonadaceae bacterium]
MQISAVPAKFPIPWANAATSTFVRPIPITSQAGGAASLEDGFPPPTFSPIAAGGVPPDGRDMNGVLKQITGWSQFLNAGALALPYDATFSGQVSGYPKTALLAGVNLGTLWFSTADNNTADPDGAGTNWMALGGGLATLASAATVDLGSVPQNVITITGAAAITSFGSTMAPGTQKTLRFASSLVLTYNATSLILPGQANLATAGGDTATVIAIGGGNYIISEFQRASGGPIAGGIIYPGTVMDFAGASAPPGYLLCYGQAISRTSFAALFNAIGTAFGAGDGSTTFNVPDVRGRVSAGDDNMGGTAANRLTTAGSGVDGATLGAVGGAQDQTLTTAQIPAHAHTLTLQAGGGNQGGTPPAQFSADTAIFGSATATTSSVGSGAAHPNVQPTIIFSKIIKT